MNFVGCFFNEICFICVLTRMDSNLVTSPVCLSVVQRLHPLKTRLMNIDIVIYSIWIGDVESKSLFAKPFISSVCAIFPGMVTGQTWKRHIDLFNLLHGYRNLRFSFSCLLWELCYEEKKGRFFSTG